MGATIHDEIRFTHDDAQRAADEWGFNCGPGALCAVLGKTPDEIRPHLGDFESKGYTNPTLMADILRNLQIPFRRKYECAVGPVDGRPLPTDWPHFGLVRIQWGGPWTNPGVPLRVRYRYTHWIGFRQRTIALNLSPSREVFDVNAVSIGGWTTFSEWRCEVVPWLLQGTKANGQWWPTHCWELLV